MTPPPPPPPPPPPAKRRRCSATSPNTATRTATTAMPPPAPGAPTPAHDGEREDEAGWQDKMEGWDGGTSGEEPNWATWLAYDEARFPPLARARHAGLCAVLKVVKRRLSAAKQHAADVLSWEETVIAKEALQLWELLDDVAIRVTTTALDSVRRERLAQDARFVADGGPPLNPHRPLA